MKISDILSSPSDKPTISFEFFPPKTPEAVVTLLARVSRLAKFHPAWVDLTWDSGGSHVASAFDLCSKLQRNLGITVMMHLTCINTTESELIGILTHCKEAGIENILALRGDLPKLTADQPGDSRHSFLCEYRKVFIKGAAT